MKFSERVMARHSQDWSVKVREGLVGHRFPVEHVGHLSVPANTVQPHELKKMYERTVMILLF